MKILLNSMMAILFVGWPFPNPVSGQLDSILFEEAIVKGLISYRAQVPETRRGLELQIESRTEREILLRFLPGQVFTCEGDYQPQVITRPKDVLVSAHEQRRIGLSASCGNATALAPPLKHSFEMSHYLDPVGQQILGELSELRLDEHRITRSVVWMFTNDRPIMDLHPGDLDGDTYDLVMDRVLGALGNEVTDPGYRVAYQEPGEDMRFTGIPEEIMGRITVDLSLDETVAIEVARMDGQTLRSGAVHFPPFDGLEELGFELDVRGLEQGQYLVQVVSLEDPTKVRGSMTVQL